MGNQVKYLCGSVKGNLNYLPMSSGKILKFKLSTYVFLQKGKLNYPLMSFCK